MKPTVKSFCETYGAEPLFKTQSEYEEFVSEWVKEMKPVLDENAKARFNSWLQSKKGR